MCSTNKNSQPKVVLKIVGPGFHLEMSSFFVEQGRTRDLFRGVLGVRRGIKSRGNPPEADSAEKGPFPTTR